MKKIRLLPAFVTLLAGAITSITLYLLRVETHIMLLILLAVLIIFYVLGVIAMKIIMDCPPKEKEEKEQEEGEVTPKEEETADKNAEKAKAEQK